MLDTECYSFPKSSEQILFRNLGYPITRKPNGKVIESINPGYSTFETKFNLSGEIDIFEENLINKSKIILIAGKRGSGKSTLGFRVLENIKTSSARPMFTIGVSQELLPYWITAIESIEEAENNGVILVDEGAISFSCRNSMSAKNKELSNLLAIARHKDMTLILITQNTSMIDKNVLNLCDTIVLKEGSLLQSEMERICIRKLYKRANGYFRQLDEDLTSYAYIIDDEFEGVVKTRLPSFWREEISKNGVLK